MKQLNEKYCHIDFINSSCDSNVSFQCLQWGVGSQHSDFLYLQIRSDLIPLQSSIFCGKSEYDRASVIKSDQRRPLIVVRVKLSLPSLPVRMLVLTVARLRALWEGYSFYWMGWGESVHRRWFLSRTLTHVSSVFNSFMKSVSGYQILVKT